MFGLEIRARRKWVSLTLLSIVVPMSLLATFRLSGILQEPLAISETKTLEAVMWGIERPSHMIDIRDDVKSFYDDECVSINYSIFVNCYIQGFQDYGGSDCVNMKVDVTATANHGFISSINITFWEDYENSEVRFCEVQAWPKFYSHVENLSIVDYAHHLWGKGSKAFMELAGVNHPKSVYFHGTIHWILRSPQNKTHLMEIAVELVYFNGTAYRKIVHPFQLKIGPDDNDGFETAGEIAGTVYSLYIGGYDTDDYYKFYVQEGHKISIGVDMPRSPSPSVELLLYDPEQNYKDHVRLNNPPYPSLNFTAGFSGYWYLRVRLVGDFGFYSLTVNTYPPEGD